MIQYLNEFESCMTFAIYDYKFFNYSFISLNIIFCFFLFMLQQSVSALLELALGQAFVNAMLDTQGDIVITVRNNYMRLFYENII